MTQQAIIQLALYLGVLLLLAYPLSLLITKIMNPTTGVNVLERGFYKLCGVKYDQEMNWKQYALAILALNVLGVLVVYALQRLQASLPLNPQAMAAVSVDSSFNTAISFVTNTNWQGYAGEVAMSYLTQMLGLAVQNFLSAATGIVVAIALIRGFARHDNQSIGNAWVDITRCTLYILLPLSFVIALMLMQQGVVQNFDAYQEVTTLQGQTQTIAMGPVASQEAIKELGTNGGGFFNANSAHPYENPTPLSNFIEMITIFLIPAALCLVFGRMVGDLRQGWAVLGAMTLIFVVMYGVAVNYEQVGNPMFTSLGVDQTASDMQAGGNMESKETRFGIVATSLFATITTSASCGAVNGMHDSFTPLGGLVPMWLMQLGEVIFGGVGSGLYGMLVFAILAVFLAGLMIGRTPEYLGKKIEAFDMKVVSIAILATPALVLIGTAIAVMSEAGRVGIYNPGAHGFSEILYAFSSAANNNGSAFAGLSANTPFYNFWLGLAMWFGRFGVLVPVLALAGSLARKKKLAITSGSMPTHGPLFIVLLMGTVLLVGALTYVPALALGPVVEHLIMNSL